MRQWNWLVTGAVLASCSAQVDQVTNEGENELGFVPRYCTATSGTYTTDEFYFVGDSIEQSIVERGEEAAAHYPLIAALDPLSQDPKAYVLARFGEIPRARFNVTVTVFGVTRTINLQDAARTALTTALDRAALGPEFASARSFVGDLRFAIGNSTLHLDTAFDVPAGFAERTAIHRVFSTMVEYPACAEPCPEPRPADVLASVVFPSGVQPSSDVALTFRPGRSGFDVAVAPHDLGIEAEDVVRALLRAELMQRLPQALPEQTEGQLVSLLVQSLVDCNGFAMGLPGFAQTTVLALCTTIETEIGDRSGGLIEQALDAIGLDYNALRVDGTIYTSLFRPEVVGPLHGEWIGTGNRLPLSFDGVVTGTRSCRFAESIAETAPSVE